MIVDTQHKVMSNYAVFEDASKFGYDPGNGNAPLLSRDAFASRPNLSKSLSSAREIQSLEKVRKIDRPASDR